TVAVLGAELAPPKVPRGGKPEASICLRAVLLDRVPHTPEQRDPDVVPRLGHHPHGVAVHSHRMGHEGEIARGRRGPEREKEDAREGRQRGPSYTHHSLPIPSCSD